MAYKAVAGPEMEAELAQQIDLAVPSQPEDRSNEALDEDPPAPPEPAISQPPAAANSSEEENEATTLPKFTRVYVKGILPARRARLFNPARLSGPISMQPGPWWAGRRWATPKGPRAYC